MKNFSVVSDGFIVTAKAEPAEELRYTLSPILVPGETDLQGDVVDEEEIRKAIWGMPTKDGLLDLEHYLVNEKLGRPVEKYQLPADTLFVKNAELMNTPEAQQKLAQIAQLQKELVEMGACRLVKKGSAMLGVQWSPVIWAMIKSGHLRGLSIYGTGTRVPIEDEPTPTATPTAVASQTVPPATS